MALTLTTLPAPDGGDNSQRRTTLAGTGVFSGSYTAGGEAINWTTTSSASGGDVAINTLFPTAPVWVEFQLATPAATPLAYLFLYNYTTNKLQVYDTGAAVSTGFAELAAGAYPTGLLTPATVRFKVEFRAE